MKNKDQRVGVFFDVGNLYYSAKSLYKARVNFSEILKEAVSGRKLIRAIAYAIRSQGQEEETFFDALKKSGIEVNLKDLQTFTSGVKKGNVDIDIAVDIMKLAPKLDAVVLVSGDGDFRILLHHVKAEGCRVEVVSFKKSTATKLIEEVDGFTDLGENLKRYTIKKTSRKK